TVFGRAIAKLEDQFGNDHYETAEARMLLALTEDEGSLDAITISLRQLLTLWQEQTGQLISDQAGQSIRLKWIVEDYLSRVFAENRDGEQLGNAFEIAETLRSGMVQQALVQTALRRLAPDAKTRDLIRRQQDMQQKLGVLHQRLSDGESYAQVSSGTLENLETKIAETESAVAQMTDAVRSAVPDYDTAVGLLSFKLAHATGALKPDEAIVALTSGRKESFVWVLTSDGRVSGQRIAKKQADWRDDVDAVRTSIEPTDGRLDDMMDFDTKTAYGLYRDLLQPFEDHWSPAKHLIFVTDTALASLPMGMLLRTPVTSIANDDQMFAGFKDLPWLIRTHAISMTPSASSLVLLRQGDVANEQRVAFLGVGDPIFDPDEAPGQEQVVEANQSRGKLVLRTISTTRGLDKATLRSLPRLRDTAEEIEAIADVLGADHERDIFIGTRANEATMRQMSQDGTLRNYRILSFATHGLVPGDLDGLMSPALALSAPRGEPQGAWDDGLLTAEEIMELDLDADWAILSACNTAEAQSSSTEAFSGLGRAFFYAGARSLMLSNWPVHSDSTRQLMVSLFKHEATASSRAEALRRASLEIMDNGVSDNGDGPRFSYAHPLFWAPFTLVGDGGGGKPAS
ncbi:MAG: CHAT domain-containing protein, partial [Pirellulaceae bacterium]|nr:CHAT domain-containing protein [Pirellulaceae bacterium]